MQKGAYSYILKPFDNDRLVIYVQKALAMFRVVKENRRLRFEVESKYRFDSIIGKSSAMRKVFEMIQKVAPTSATVLIEGESGTGKELVAKSIHFNSPRRNGPFVAVNCSALADSLLESELFGHEKGAFTGAVSSRKGRFELADKGTLFLDEIGDMSLNLQVKLLRVLQERIIERVGGNKSIKVDIRLIAATNKNLAAEVAAERFRSDLYYRLNVLHIDLPPLRERPEDIRLLIEHFIEKYSTERNAAIAITGADQEAERLLHAYKWPGNVRQLENVIEQAVILSPGEKIGPMDLPNELIAESEQGNILDHIPEDANLFDTLADIEKKMIQRALGQAQNVQSEAAAVLGIGKSGLSKKLKKYNIEIS
jgi:two-component system NtrC family response regulator